MKGAGNHRIAIAITSYRVIAHCAGSNHIRCAPFSLFAACNLLTVPANLAWEFYFEFQEVPWEVTNVGAIYPSWFLRAPISKNHLYHWRGNQREPSNWDALGSRREPWVFCAHLDIVRKSSALTFPAWVANWPSSALKWPSSYVNVAIHSHCTETAQKQFLATI